MWSCELVEYLFGLSYFGVILPFVLLFLPEVKCIVGFLAVPSQVTADAYLIKLAKQTKPQRNGELGSLQTQNCKGSKVMIDDVFQEYQNV